MQRPEPLFLALGNETRWRILQSLGRATAPEPVNQMADNLGIRPSVLSSHLVQLYALGLIDCTVSGPRKFYSINTSAIIKLMNSLRQLLGESENES